MIIKASQRGGANRLAAHLLNANDNEHVEIHEVSGFMADTLPEALQEAYAISRGTKCSQFLFSVSLNPPANENVPVAVFEDAANRIERKMGLNGQPRAIILHEKHGRRHAHAVWSRIDSQAMRAVNLPYFKNRLMEISKQLYLEYGWDLPKGFIDPGYRNPLNFTRGEWAQAKRLKERPEAVKTALKECWAVSGDKDGFTKALEKRGFYLARGDRRGYVAVDWRGEVYSLSRSLEVKPKELKARLGSASELPSVEETKAGIDRKLAERVQGFVDELRQQYDRRLAPLLAQKDGMKARHSRERRTLAEKQEQRAQEEAAQRQARYKAGFRGLWDRLTGKHSRISRENEAEADRAHMRARAEKDRLIARQLQERRSLQQGVKHLQTQEENDLRQLKEMLFSKMPEDKIRQLERSFTTARPVHGRRFDLEL